MLNFLKKKEKQDTKFSLFFRNASSAEKKKLFNQVLKRATEEQKKLLSL